MIIPESLPTNISREYYITSIVYINIFYSIQSIMDYVHKDLQEEHRGAIFSLRVFSKVRFELELGLR